MPFDSILFDLDGVLWDTCAACARAWNQVAREHGIAYREMEAQDVRAVAGRPHEECIRRSYPGLDERSLQLLVEGTTVADNELVAREGGQLYPGVLEGLLELAGAYPLFIVSNCQSGYIETFLRFSGTAALFRDFECWGNTGQPKAANLRAVVARNRLRAPVYVGDTEGDQTAASEAGIPFVAVHYGFGKPASELATITNFGQIPRFFGH